MVLNVFVVTVLLRDTKSALAAFNARAAVTSAPFALVSKAACIVVISALAFKAVCVSAEIGLFASLVFSTLPRSSKDFDNVIFPVSPLTD